MIQAFVAIPSLYAEERAESLFNLIETLYCSEKVDPVISLCLQNYPVKIASTLRKMVYTVKEFFEPITVSHARDVAMAPFLNPSFVVHCDDDVTFHPQALFEMYRVLLHCPTVGLVNPIGCHSPGDLRFLEKMDQEGLFALRAPYTGGCWAMRTELCRTIEHFDITMPAVEDQFMHCSTYACDYEAVWSRARVDHHSMRSSGIGRLRKELYMQGIARLKEIYGDLVSDSPTVYRFKFSSYPSPSFEVPLNSVPTLEEDIRRL